MQLSEAIILGSMAYPKAIGERHAEDGPKCALGAAESAIGIMNYAGWPTTKAKWPILALQVPHPMSSVTTCISSLNNGKCWFDNRPMNFEPWSREALASWVATLEAQQAKEAEVAELAHA